MKNIFGNASPDYPYNIKSASKSIITLLVGIAVDRGDISIDETLGDHFPEYFASEPNTRKESITIRNMLSMQSGLETTSFYNYGRWVISDDWVEFQLDQPLEEEPGGKMVYSTGISHLLSVVITKATDMSTKAFAEKYLFGPLNIQVGGWDRDPQGYYMGGNNMALTPLDLMKIGQLMLNGGSWNDEQIVSKEWVRDSFQTYTRSNFNPYDYGYMWWIRSVAGYDVYFAWGFGGQYIYIIPELNSVAVITSFLGNATQRRTYKEPIFELLEKNIIPYLENN
ncbi:MAG: serine hydrolase [Gracilimonas sp.]|nr:serine hydrolase [Gracilimonas sp.]